MRWAVPSYSARSIARSMLVRSQDPIRTVVVLEGSPMAPTGFSDGSFSEKGCTLLSSLNARIQRNSEGKSLLSSCSFSPFQSASNFSRRHFFTSKAFKFTNVCFSLFTSLRASHFYSVLLEDELSCNRNTRRLTSLSHISKSAIRSNGSVCYFAKLRCSDCHNLDMGRRLKSLAPYSVNSTQGQSKRTAGTQWSATVSPAQS